MMNLKIMEVKHLKEKNKDTNGNLSRDALYDACVKGEGN